MSITAPNKVTTSYNFQCQHVRLWSRVQTQLLASILGVSFHGTPDLNLLILKLEANSQSKVLPLAKNTHYLRGIPSVLLSGDLSEPTRAVAKSPSQS